ncbi:hypothetical protein KIW84_012194 [Lathyrus oleraceus]|uniref:Uncharacterized protein n=1 Tax=Pisum sativum TaxID=3888 RepID=A0A9D5BH15_PEA|nr:hypothetical protein KIW84_012194 [Pisum sativum]
MKGSRWRIGDGLKVRIWEDNWLPITHGFKVISAPRGLDKDDRVENLIDRLFVVEVGTGSDALLVVELVRLSLVTGISIVTEDSIGCIDSGTGGGLDTESVVGLDTRTDGSGVDDSCARDWFGS